MQSKQRKHRRQACRASTDWVGRARLAGLATEACEINKKTAVFVTLNEIAGAQHAIRGMLRCNWALWGYLFKCFGSPALCAYVFRPFGTFDALALRLCSDLLARYVADVLGLRFSFFRRLLCSRATPVQRNASKTISVDHGQKPAVSRMLGCYNCLIKVALSLDALM